MKCYYIARFNLRRENTRSHPHKNHMVSVTIPSILEHINCILSDYANFVRCLICKCSTELVLCPGPTTTELAESTPTELISQCKCTAYT